MAFIKDISGQQFSYLTVIGRNPVNTNNGKPRWNCVCVCGNNVTIASSNLISGSQKSCGCWRKENMSISRKTHGESKTPEYNAWVSMKKRCYNDTSENYINYGGRGIEVCERWKDSYENFIEDMGHRPTNSHSLERKENNSNYGPDNCVWATPIDQANNRRSNTYFEYNGEKLTIAQLSRKTGISYDTLLNRLENRSTVEEAINFIPHSGKKQENVI